MSKKSSTFRLSFIRRRILTTFHSKALRAALLAELDGGEDAALVVQMVERVGQARNPPTQAVAPQPRQVVPRDGQLVATAVEISDSEEEMETGRSSGSD